MSGNTPERRKKDAPPPTPRRPKPWDPPAPPPVGALTRDSVFLEVGRALSAWEAVEGNLAYIFATLVAPRGSQLAALRAYGSVLTGRGRVEMILAAAAALFFGQEEAKEYAALRNLLEEAAGFAGRRNEIAHGIVGRYDVGRLVSRRATPSYVLGPPQYATKKTTLKPRRSRAEVVHHAPRYAYSDAQLDALRRQFARLELQAVGVWIDLIVFAERLPSSPRKRPPPPS